MRVENRALSRRGFIGALPAAGFPLLVPAACRAQPPMPPLGLDLREFGAVGNGVADDGPAFARALEAAANRGLPLMVPRGVFLITDRHIHRGGRPFAPGTRGELAGSGSGSVLRFSRYSFPSFFGLTLVNDDIEVRDLVIELDRNGSGWVAAACVTQAVSNLKFIRVGFRGVGGRTGHIGVMPLNANITGALFDQCRFESLDFGFSKQTTDVSTQRDLVFTDCVGVNCTEVLEFNSPGLFRAIAVAGSPTVTGITDDGGSPFDTSRLALGQEVRSRLFPTATRISSVSPGGVTLSAPALRSASRMNPGRFSIGGCTAGVIRNLRVRNIAQWGVGFANCDDWDVEVYGEDVGFELVHVEDGSRRFNVVAGGVRCNKLPGVVGSSGADNGMVSISTGSHDIAVRFADADLRESSGRLPSALAVQAGGIMGTTGQEVDPHGIRVGGRILMRDGQRAIIAYNSDIRFDDLEIINADSSAPQEALMRLHGSTWSGSIRVRNGRRLIEPHPRARGRFESVVVLP